jgi:hypothetical protein
MLIVYLFSFIVLVSGRARFIYRRVKKIYDVSLLESSTFINQPITTDMETLTKWRSLQLTKMEIKCEKNTEENFLEMYRMNWKLIIYG